VHPSDSGNGLRGLSLGFRIGPVGRAEDVSWVFFRFSGGRCGFEGNKGGVRWPMRGLWWPLAGGLKG
jgi:hypothetical protein